MKAPDKFDPEAIRAEAEKKITEQQTISRLYPHIPDNCEAFEVFVCKTSYSADYFVKIEARRYPHDSQKITPAIIRELAAAFPPEPVRYYKGDEAVSFLPVAVFEKFPQQKQDRYQEERNIAPFIVKVEAAEFARHVVLKWWSEVAGIGRVNVEVVMPMHAQPFGVSRVEYKGTGRFGREGKRVERNEFIVSEGFQIIRGGDGSGAEVAQMRYASGSDETPGQHVIYWEPYNPQPVPLAALIDAIEAAEQVTA